MYILTDTTHSLEMVTGSAVSIDYVVAWADHGALSFSPGSNQGNVSTAATTTIVSAPASGVQRQITGVTITNRHGSSSNTVQVFKRVGASAYAASQNLTLLAGQTCVMDSNGNLGIIKENNLYVSPGKLLQSANSLAFTGTDGTSHVFPSTNSTLARTDAAQTFSGNQTFSGIVYANGSVQSTSYGAFTPTSTITSGTGRALDGSVTVYPATDSTATYYGVGIGAYTSASCTASITGSGSLRGLTGEIFHYGTGNVAAIYGFTINVSSKSTSGTTAYMAGVSVAWGNTVSGGTVTEARGLYVGTLQTTGTVGTAYGLYINNVSGASTNYAIKTFSGLVGFGDTTDSTSSTTGAVTTSGGIGAAKAIYTGTLLGVSTIGDIRSYSLTTTSSSTVSLAELDATVYRSVDFLISARDATSGKTQHTKIAGTHNGSAATYSSYSNANLTGDAASYTIDYSGGLMRLRVTPASSNSTVFRVMAMTTKI